MHLIGPKRGWTNLNSKTGKVIAEPKCRTSLAKGSRLSRYTGWASLLGSQSEDTVPPAAASTGTCETRGISAPDLLG